MGQEAVGGWNDCPTPMLASLTGRSTRRRQRVGHTFGKGKESEGKSDEERRTVLPTPPISREEKSSEAKSSDISKESVASDSSRSTPAESIDRLFNLASSLKDPEKTSLKSKIESTTNELTPDQGQFLATITEEAENFTHGTTTNSSTKILRQRVVDYMIMNDGVSGWCLPLKKTIENLNNTNN